MRRTAEIFGKIDGITILLYVVLVFFGWINIYASMHNDDLTNSIFDLNTKYGKQLLFIGISLFVGFVILIIDWSFFDSLAFLFYGIVVLFLVIILFSTDSTGGATSWFRIGSFKIQPSEFSKFATALALAKMFSLNRKNKYSFNSMARSYIVLLVPVLLIILQNDLGTALVFTSFILVFYREGLSGNVLIVGLVLFALALFSLLITPWILAIIVTSLIVIVFLISSNRVRSLKISTMITLISNGIIFSTDYIFHNLLSAHHIERVNILLGKEFDPLGAGYNLIQSKIAIGSGGLFGKGFLNGTQSQLEFLPERGTDFIFAVFAEEFGFIGILILFLFYLILIARCIHIVGNAKNYFSKIIAGSITSIFILLIITNISMAIGVLPVVGVTLPLLSLGGSSLLSIFIAFGIIFSVNRRN